MATGTLELLAKELALALAPLEQRLSGNGRDAFLAELGLRLPGGLGAAGDAMGAAAAQAAGLTPIVAKLTAAIDNDDVAGIVQQGVALIGVLSQVLDAILALGPALVGAVTSAAGLTAAQRTRLQAEMAQLPKRLLDFVVLSYLEGRSENAIGVLTLVGVVDDSPVPIDPSDPTVLPVRHRVLHFDRLLALFTDPAGFLSGVFDFGSPSFDGAKLFARVAAYLTAFDLPFAFLAPPGGPPALEAFVVRLSVDPATSPPSAVARLRVPATQDVTFSVPIGPLWTLTVTVRGRFDGGLEGRFQPPLNVALSPPTGGLEIDASLALTAQRADPIVLLGEAGASRVEVDRLAVALGLRATAAIGGTATVEPSAQVELDGGHVLIDLSSGDGFISTIAGNARIESTFDLHALWTPSTGLRFGGSGGLELAIPTHLELGPIEITSLYLSVRLADDGSVPTEISGAFKASLGPIEASVDRVGLVVTSRFPAGGGNLGPLDLGFAFKPPNGVGLAVNAGVISGGGYLFFDPDHGEYAGALDLEFANFVELKAIGLISTRMPDGSAGFSMLIVITAEFGSGIQLGYGFTLLAVGGLIGLNRGMNLQALVEGVRTGSIESVMFPTDIIANAPRILSDLRTFFPPRQGTFLIGPMAKIGWGTPTLVSVSLGVIIEIPPGNIAILGVLRCILPTQDLALLALQVDFVGALEVDKSRLWFFASLFDSHILTMTIEGEMGLLVDWGDKPDFVLTVGGFHPSFKPPPLPFPVPKRLAVDILNQPGELIRVSGYFAVTSNTVQFGAKAELRLGFDDFGIEGHLSFDALFRFSPFAFTIDIAAGVSLKAFGVGLFSIDLRFQLEGPAPWRAHGRGSISLLFFEISADFDFSWGESHNTTLPPVEVLALLATEVAKVEGWQTRLPTGSGKALVNLRTLPDTDQVVLHPLGTLLIRQRAIPLDVRLDRVGAQRPSDGKRFSVAPGPDSGLVQVSVTDDKFAMAQFQDMNDAEKLSRRAYENQDAGLELTAAAGTLASARVVRRSARYELHIIDSGVTAPAQAATAVRPTAVRPMAAAIIPVAAKPKRFHDVSSAVFGQLLQGSSTSRSALSRKEALLRQPFATEDTVRLTDQRFVVAYTRNNLQAFPPSLPGVTSATFRSLTTASDALAEWVAADPSLAGTLHVIPAVEAGASLAAPGTWSAAGALPSAVAGVDAVRLASGKVLVAGGSDSAGHAIPATALFDPVANIWTAAPPLATGRREHTTTKLGDGRVLVTGGRADAGGLASVESYDPASGTWSTEPHSMAGARAAHSATVLADGRLLVAGGRAARGTHDDGALSTVELFDPVDRTWAPAAPMIDARSGHQAVPLADGSVLVIGGALLTGAGERALAYCERYHPATDTWTATGSLGTARKGHQATVLADGRVLVTGGDAPGAAADGTFRPASLGTAELYDPVTGSWTPAHDMPGGRRGHRSVLLRSGAVLVIGGTGGPAFTTGFRHVTVYDPASDTWTATGGQLVGRADFGAVELADGRVLAAGGLVLAGAAAPGPDPVELTAASEVLIP
jgi:hypothetical protein